MSSYSGRYSWDADTIDIRYESLVCRLTVGGYSRGEGLAQLGIDNGSETDGYRLTVGGYSGNADRY